MGTCRKISIFDLILCRFWRISRVLEKRASEIGGWLAMICWICGNSKFWKDLWNMIVFCLADLRILAIWVIICWVKGKSAFCKRMPNKRDICRFFSFKECLAALLKIFGCLVFVTRERIKFVKEDLALVDLCWARGSCSVKSW